MSDNTHIEWTDATWNPITGCSVVSAGCKHCYAMKLAGTRLAHHPSRSGLTIDTKAGPVWTGEVRFNEHWLDQPLRWKRPRRIFVCAHGDLFHESVPDEWIDKVFAVMALAPQHTFQVLTKRPDRMRLYFQRADLADAWWNAGDRMACEIDLPEGPGEAYLNAGKGKTPITLPNVWLGVSVEDQEAANERIPLLLQVPASVRWISAEPLLGRVDLCEILGIWWNQTMGCWESSGAEVNRFYNGRGDGRPLIGWVVAGGESGTGARPMHPDWARSLRNQCAAAGVPFLFKQWGAWVTEDQSPMDITLPGTSRLPWAKRNRDGDWSTKGDQTAVYRVGKKAAGRELDGVLHDGYPVPA